jgi:glycosyltransferase involved in cell wall biosynthesis
MKIALVSEGTYPFAMGGVSTWCDQMIRGLPQYQWDMVALTIDGNERPIWPEPKNLASIQQIPLWGPSPAGRRRPGRPGAAFASSYDALLESMLASRDPRSDQAMVARSRFLLALRGLFEYASSGGDLAAALTSNAAVGQLAARWKEAHHCDLSVADALEAADLIGHMLRPLATPPVRCDIVHATMNGLSMLVAMTAKWRYGTPVVMSEQGIYLRERYLAYLDEENTTRPVRTLMLSFHRSLAGAGYLISDALAPHSTYNRRWQLQNGADPDRMWTMYNGVETAAFPLAQAEPDRPTIVFMGRINPLKDLHTLIRAFAHVRTQVPNALLRIFGVTPLMDEEYAQSCRRLIADLGLTDSALFEGAVDSPVTAYHAGHVVALTSVSEGFPVVIVEAMACGRPIVCTNVGGVAEAVADAGFVVPPRDHMAVAEACVRLLRDDALRHRMAAEAHARVMRLFALRQSLDAYRRVYQSLTAAHAKSATTTAMALALEAPLPPAPPGPPPATPHAGVPAEPRATAQTSQAAQAAQIAAQISARMSAQVMARRPRQATTSTVSIRSAGAGRACRPRARGRVSIQAGEPR